MKQLLVLACGIFCAAISHAQSCNCEKEFIHIRNIVEKNFAGFADRVKALSPEVYKKTADDLQQLTRDRFSSDNCPLIINKYLDLFKSHHLGFSLATDPYKTDTDYISKRPLYPLSNKAFNVGSASASWEGNYVFTTDTLYSIAVIKDSTPLHDYIGVVLTSKIPTWKKGMIKFEGKRVNDSLLTGLLYMRNHRPKIENFLLWDNKNKIGGDWIRMGSSKEITTTYPKMQQWSSWPNLNAAKLSPHTFYMRIGSFGGNARQSIDSMLSVHAALLDTTPNLVLDLRSNAGGADEAWQH
ncbi:MAG TPA: hypothetical protein VL307_14690, partial [Chitinophagaceae bacterium]|nr:hypothetical protein [Chitinophagaceae bacterium]